MAVAPSSGDNGSNNGWTARKGKWVYDPDNDGDNDATAATDTDHSHWNADGKQIKRIPPKPSGSPDDQDSREAAFRKMVAARRGKLCQRMQRRTQRRLLASSLQSGMKPRTLRHTVTGTVMNTARATCSPPR